jgi:hypothetical protein
MSRDPALPPRALPTPPALGLVALALLSGCGSLNWRGDRVDETDGDGDGYTADVDCDDRRSSVHPGADEYCNDRDDDCDGETDEDAQNAQTWFRDADGDGYGDPATEGRSCEVPDEAVLTGLDCDDTSARAHPSATEVCDDADEDEDCDGAADDDDEAAEGKTLWGVDSDGDGYGAMTDNQAWCDPPGDLREPTDCDDDDATVYPGAPDDPLDGVDSNCDCDSLPDLDGDGFVLAECGGEDCNDDDPASYPGAAEVCDDGVDQDCDGTPSPCALWGAVGWEDAQAVLLAGQVTFALPVGDLDGDGLVEMALDRSSPGRVWLSHGGSTGSFDLLSEALVLASSDGREVTLMGPGSGDLDGDGYPDLLAGTGDRHASWTHLSPHFERTVDALAVVPGPWSGWPGGRSDTVFLETTSSFQFSPAPLADLNGDGATDLIVGTNDFRAYAVAGPVAEGQSVETSAFLQLEITAPCGGAISAQALPDQDGDGIADIAVFETFCGAGKPLFVFRGGLSGVLSSDDADVALSHDSTEALGVVVSADMDQDGHADLMLGYPTTISAGTAVGEAALLLGPLSGAVSTASAAALVMGDTTATHTGATLAVQGDLQGDGIPDLLIGAPGAGSAGRVYGLAGPLSGTLTVRGAAVLSVAPASGTTGRHGFQVAWMGDHDGDGHDDWVVTNEVYGAAVFPGGSW